MSHFFMYQVYGCWVQEYPGRKLTPSQPHPGVMPGMQLVYGCGLTQDNTALRGHCTIFGDICDCHTGGVPGIEWGDRDSAQHPKVPRKAPTESDLASVSPMWRGDTPF